MYLCDCVQDKELDPALWFFRMSPATIALRLVLCAVFSALHVWLVVHTVQYASYFPHVEALVPVVSFGVGWVLFCLFLSSRVWLGESHFDRLLDFSLILPGATPTAYEFVYPFFGDHFKQKHGILMSG
jgi:hypothetical protein